MAEELGMLEYISRKITYVFGGYILYTFALRHLPDTFSEVGKFTFFMFLNFGVQWVCYKLMFMCSRLWLDRIIFALQLGMFGWTVYAYRFVYDATVAYDKSAFFNVPMQQYVILFGIFMVLLVLKTADGR